MCDIQDIESKDQCHQLPNSKVWIMFSKYKLRGFKFNESLDIYNVSTNYLPNF